MLVNRHLCYERRKQQPFSSYVSSCSLSISSMVVSVKSVSKGAKLLLICFLSEHETLLLLFYHLPLSLSFSSNFSPFYRNGKKRRVARFCSKGIR